MLLIAIAITWLGYKFGEGQGWWGSMRSGGGSTGGGGGRTGGGSTGGTRVSGPKPGRSTGSGAVRGLGSRVGKALGWRDAKKIHDRDEPPVTWGDAWREGLESGRERGRERYDEGQKRKLEREQQRQWLAQAEERSGELPDGAEVPIVGRYFRDRERRVTCPDCGHGNTLNNSRVSCDCSNDLCACGDPDAWIGPDEEDEVPDYSRPLDEDDEQRWGPPEDVDDPVDEVAEKRRERSPAEGEPSVPVFTDGERVEDENHGRQGVVRVRESDPEDIAEGSPPVRTTVLWDPHPDSPNLTVEDEIDDTDRDRLRPVPDDSTPPGDGDTPNEENDMSAPTAPSPNMSGEIINFDSARDVLRGISTKMHNLSDASVETANEHRGTVAACDAAIAGLSSIDSDQETIGDFIALREQAQEALEAAERAQVEAAESAGYATTVIGNIDQRHGAIEEAVRAAKHAAKIDAYKAS